MKLWECRMTKCDWRLSAFKSCRWITSKFMIEWAVSAARGHFINKWAKWWPIKLLSQLSTHPALQPMVVSVNKPFKNMTHKMWINSWDEAQKVCHGTLFNCSTVKTADSTYGINSQHGKLDVQVFSVFEHWCDQRKTKKR